MNAKKASLLIVVVLTGVFCLSMINIPAVSAQSEVTLDISPREVLFDIDNMKPGDWAPRTVLIQNNGQMDFDYVMTVKSNSKSMKLFNELLLEVNGTEGNLYNGKLADFKELEQRSLKSSEKEKIDFTVRFPNHLGNDYQGLDAAFTLNFSAEGSDHDKDEQSLSGMITGMDGDSDVGGAKLPATATNMFTTISLGLLLIAGGSGLVLYNRRRAKEKP